MSEKFFIRLTFTVFAALFFACNSKEDVPTADRDVAVEREIPAIYNSETLVSQEKAIDISSVFFSQKFESGDMKTRSGKLQSFVTSASKASIETIVEDSSPLMHVVNYPEGGFVIVSATRSYFPILAYSEDNNFVLASEEEMRGLTVWLDETKAAIRSSDSLDDETKGRIRMEWRSYETIDFDNMIATWIQQWIYL